jgi:hypothetical protein
MSIGKSSMRATWLVSVTFFLFVGTQAASATPVSSCALPQGLDSEITKKFPGARLVTLADLDDYDRKLYKKDHGARCPGLVKVDFYGDAKPTWALVLISGQDPKRRAELVVARKLDADWEIRSLEITDGTPVVWREGAGKYDGMNDDKTIQARTPVIVFCGYESWAIVYAWNGKDVEKVWVSD